MRIEDQCVSLEYARRLRELAVKQESIFYWLKENNDHLLITSFNNSKDHIDVCMSIPEKIYSAFTIAELGEILPYKVYKENESFYLCISKDKISWLVNYKGNPNTLCFSSDIIHPNAFARMLVFLVENNLLTEEWRKQWLEE